VSLVSLVSSHAQRLALGAAAVLVLAAPAAAQTRTRPLKTTRVTVSVSGGVQAAASNLSEHFSLDRNLETQTVDVTYPMKTGVLVDVSAGYRLWKNLGVGVAVSRANDDGSAQVDASIPHPFLFNQPRTISGKESGIVHAETGVHFQVQYLVPSSTHLNLVLSAGPSWLTVEQEAVTGVIVTESYPYDTAAFGGAVTKLLNTSGPGFHAGVDLAWMFSRNAGIGGLVRYTHANVDLEVAEGRTIGIEAGGVQGGVGIRVKF
jgi:hypothetical protein